MSDVVVKVGQLWRLKEKEVRYAVKKFSKEEGGIVDYEIDALHRMAFELKFRVLEIDQDETNRLNCVITVEDVNNIILSEPTKIHLGALLKEFQIDEFSE